MLINAKKKKRKGNRNDGQFLSLIRIINEDVIDGQIEERTLTCCDRIRLMSLILYRAKKVETDQIKIDCRRAWQ
jgi:hypothetical protein